MSEISLSRLYLLRALYLFIVVGLGLAVMPGIISHAHQWGLMEGVVNAMLAAFWVLSMVGLRYPLQMPPILFWELLWKLVWLISVAMPLWLSGQMDEATWQMAIGILMVVIIPFAIPWSYVWANYVRKPSDRWR
ncbi:MAG TPA: hypothetical protein PK002_05105 [Cellvibrio sp.]|nr:hypothetical protein [Cellvibrio sp.]